MPGGGRGRIPQLKVSVNVPVVLAERIEEALKREGTLGTSVADFLRQAASEKIESLETRHSKPRDEGAEKTLRRTKTL